jgi:hypothetical protein
VVEEELSTSDERGAYEELVDEEELSTEDELAT